MSNQQYSLEFREEAVRQILDRGYSVKEASERLGISAHSLYSWVKTVKPRPVDHQELFPHEKAISHRCFRSARVKKSGDFGQQMN